MNNVYFLTQVKHNKTTNVWEKGCVVKAEENADNRAAVLQAYHAYLSAYGYGHEPNTDYVFCCITKASSGEEIMKEKWTEMVQA